MADITKQKKNLIASIKSLKPYEWVLIGIMVAVAAFSIVSAALGYNPITGKTEYNPLWLSIINFFSALAGIMCIFLCAKGSVSNYIFGIINTSVYIAALGYWTFARGESYLATFLLELIVYLPMGIVGWATWAKHRDAEKNELTKVKKLTWWQDICVGVFIVGTAILMHLALNSIGLVENDWAKIGSNYGLESVLGWLDAFIFAGGLTATFLSARRYREQYILWIIQDIVVVAQFALPLFGIGGGHFDPVYFTKKSIYLTMAIVGLINWFKLQKERNLLND